MSSWPEVIPLPTPEKPFYLRTTITESLLDSPLPKSAKPTFLTPVSPSHKHRRQSSDPFLTPTLKRTRRQSLKTANDENHQTPRDSDIQFPKSPKELTQSPWVSLDIISPMAKRKVEPQFSPMSPSNKKVKKTSNPVFLGTESPLPTVLLTDLLQINSMSPCIQKKKSVTTEKY